MRPLTSSQAIFCVVAIAIVILLPILIFGIPHGADLPNHYRFALPFYEAIRDGSAYPGWLAESNAGYGDPRFRFYPPGLYYLLIIFRTIAGSWYVGTLGTFVLISIAGGLGVYFWTRELTTPKVAIWAGILYALAPYRLNELYQASLLSEYAASSILPFAFAFTERVCRKGRASDIAGLAASLACLTLTHVPLTVIGVLSLGMYSMFRLERSNALRTLAKLGLGFSLGLFASAFFWTTVVAELSWIQGSSINPKPYYDYRVNFVFSLAALTNRNTWFANILAGAVLGFVAPAIILFKKRFRPNTTMGLKPVFIVLLVSFFMTTELSRPIWAIVPKLREVQFPWRWLAITSMFGCILLAMSIPAWLQLRRADLRPRDLLAPLAFVLSLIFVFGHVIGDSTYLGRERFESLLTEIRGAVSFKDWLPVSAREVSQMNRMNGQVDAYPREIQVTSWEPQYRSFLISSGPATEARVRTYYYPLWKATSGGNRLNVHSADDGALLIQIPSAVTSVELQFEEPDRVKLSRIISGVGWLVIFSLGLLGLLQSRLRAGQLTLETNVKSFTEMVD